MSENRPSEKASPQAPSARGRPFQKGNRGRTPGSKNRSSLVAAALLQGEATALERKALEIAEGGNVPLLKFFLARIMPRERLIKLDLPPMKSADDAVTALGAIALAMSEGVITPSEGAAMAMVVNSQARAIDGADLVKRLEVMEARYKGELMS